MGPRCGSRALALGLVVGMVAVLGPPAGAEMPFPEPTDPYDYAGELFIENGWCEDGDESDPVSEDLPAGFECDTDPADPVRAGRTGDWRFNDHREPPVLPGTAINPDYEPEAATNPQEFFGVKGAGVNRAWEVTTGRPDVVIAVLDSGIRWEENRSSLLRKHYLNRHELPVPGAGPNPSDTRFGGYDVNGDGVFNVEDYPAGSTVTWHGDTITIIDHGDDQNDVVDPADLIRLLSDGTDDDGNGYVDDISGWDFFENDNNPQDDTDYGHGTGEMEGSAGEAGVSGEGMCPNCMAMSLRVGDSFIADVNHFGEAVTYAVDNGVMVVQEALGTLNHTSFGQRALDHAYANGVIVNASEADEAAGHQNWPAAYDHTMVVNSIRESSIEEGLVVTRPHSFLYFNGCTNFGGYTYVAIPSTSCSSDATGLSSGYSGLLQSAALNALERGELSRYPEFDGTGYSERGFPISAEEAYQLWRLAADDVDFASPCTEGASDANDLPIHAFCDEAPPYVDPSNPYQPRRATADNYGVVVAPLPSTRYQTVKGWDFFTGYGRSNAARLVRYLGPDGEEYVPDGDGFTPFGVGTDPNGLTAEDRIPPEADITSPSWWRQYGYDPATQDLLWPDDPGDPDAIVVEGRVAANRVTRDGGTFDWVLEWAPHVQGLSTSQYPLAGGFHPSSGSAEDSHGPWTVAATGTGLGEPVEGELGRIAVEDVAAALGSEPNPFLPESSPPFPPDPTSRFQPEQFGIRLRLRVIAHPADAADTVNNEAVRQKQVEVYPADETAVRDGLGVGGQTAGGAMSPSFHDVDGDGSDEFLVGTSDGLVHAYTDTRTWSELPGWPVSTDPQDGVQRALAGDDSTTVDNAYTRGEVDPEVYGAPLAGTPAVADLDDDGEIEVLAADLEGRVYVWNLDGTRRFTTSVDRSLSKEPGCEETASVECDDFAPGDPKRDQWNARDWGINHQPVVGDLDPATPGLEILVGANDAHLYAWHADGAPVDGWPVVLRDPATVGHMFAGTRFWCYDDDSPTPECVGAVDGNGPVDPAIGTKILVPPSLADLDDDGDLEVVAAVNEEYGETPNLNDAEDPALGAFGQVSEAGNTRIYALHHTGAATSVPAGHPSASTPHLQDQAYVEGWPVPIALLALNLLPYVGAGSNSQPVVADLDGDGTMEVATTSAAGPGYVLNHDGSDFLSGGSNSRDEYRFLATAADHKSPTSDAQDFSSVIGVGALTVGSLDQGEHLSIAGPAAGLRRLLDIVFEADQFGAEDHLAIWDPTQASPESTFRGDYESGAPIIVNDLQFFTPPIVADVQGDGAAEVIQGTAVKDTVVAGLGDTSQTATRYFTGGWHVAAAAVGDPPAGAGDDGTLEMATITREGWLRLYPTPIEVGSDRGCAALSEWPEFGHDPNNSGNYHTDAIRPYPLDDVTASDLDSGEVTLTFTATGDDRQCGSATSYDVRSVPGHVADPEWEDAEPVTVSHDAPPPAGEADELTVTGLTGASVTLLVRARDDVGNGSAVTTVAVGNRPPVAVIAPRPGKVRAGVPVSFDGSRSSDPDDPFSSLVLTWSASDGQPATGTGATFTTTFPDRDEDYSTTVELTVTDPAGASDVVSVGVRVVDNRPPVVDAGPRKRTIVGELATFRGRATDPEGDDLSFDWRFGDGRSGSGRRVSHAYRDRGRYTAELTVRDELGESASDTTTVQAVEVRRYAGDDRIDTAIQVARDRFGAADEVVLATSQEYADALAGAPFAADRRAPILLNPPTHLDARVRQVIEDLQAQRVHLLGGDAALLPEVEDELRSMGLEVGRFAGTDRFDTARLIAGSLGGDEVYIVEGDDPDELRGWPDGMIAAPVAAFTRRPVLLVVTDALPAPTRRALDELGVRSATIAGGPVAVSDDVEAQLERDGVAVTRIAGDDRFGTSKRMAEHGQALGMSAEETWLARGDNWPDSLTGGAVIGETGGLLLLVARADLDASPPTRDHLIQQVDELLLVRLLGGHVALTPALEQDVRRLIRAP